ncbi:MAG: helix-turn-helix domain-containing protein [Bacteroidetes bacterium]|nr:helix-turn-helix domain-containing protein [Bacteroidota bacterium]
MEFKGNTHEYLRLESISSENCFVLKEKIESGLSLVWMMEESNRLKIDGQDFDFQKNEVICLTEFHQTEVLKVTAMRLVRFNRPFFCIIDHDSEVGCRGILFFGASQLPVFTIPDADLEKFELLWKMFLVEMQSRDELQMDMLQMMLKRLLILATRLYKEQRHLAPLAKNNLDLVREFNFLVESHFKTKHTVADYAEMLHRSPKTLSNVFAQISPKTPLQLINERKMLEARRLLRYTDQAVSEVAYAIGYDDVQTFSRFFKTQEGISPSAFREQN